VSNFIQTSIGNGRTVSGVNKEEMNHGFGQQHLARSVGIANIARIQAV